LNTYPRPRTGSQRCVSCRSHPRKGQRGHASGTARLVFLPPPGGHRLRHDCFVAYPVTGQFVARVIAPAREQSRCERQPTRPVLVQLEGASAGGGAPPSCAKRERAVSEPAGDLPWVACAPSSMRLSGGCRPSKRCPIRLRGRTVRWCEWRPAGCAGVTGTGGWAMTRPSSGFRMCRAMSWRAWWRPSARTCGGGAPATA
jgi:hypothetical protein